MTVATLALVAIAIGVVVISNLGYRKRRQERAILTDRVAEYAADVSSGRFVDIGVTLHTVIADPDGEHLLEGKPRLRIIHSRTYGGMLDTKRGCIVGPSRAPTTWYCSRDQEAVILHRDDEPLGQLVYGSEGSGKSTALAMWMYFRWLEMLGESREIGCAAPTEKRIKMVQDEMFRLWPKRWWRYKTAQKLLRLVDGTRVQFVSTTQTSAKGGSPVQGYNWSAAAQDELQDQVGVFDDIGSRGRAAKDGRYKQIGSCTAKEDPQFRALRDRILAALDPAGLPYWIKRTMLIAASPFISQDFIDSKRAIWTERELRRRFGAEDLPPESMLYFNWSREHCLRPIPLGAKKITSIVLRAKTGNPRHALLAGHDPGVAKSATIFLDAYQLPKQADPVWWVRGEIFGKHQTTEQSGLAIVAGARKLGSNVRPDAEIVHVRAMPVGQSEDKPDQDLYRIFKRCGLDVRAAQFKKDGTGTGHISIEARVDMVNRLLLDASGRRRLFVECDDKRQPVAPKLVEGFESLERDHEGRAETGPKDETDKTDSPCALGYALWPFEKESAIGMRADVNARIKETTR